MNYSAKEAAARIISMAENAFDPVNIALGRTSSLRDDLQQMVTALGGRKNIEGMPPDGVLLYLLSLIVVNT